MPHLTSRFTFLLAITSERLSTSCWDISKSPHLTSLYLASLFLFMSRPSVTGQDIDSPKVKSKNGNKITENQNGTRLESVVKMTTNTSKENNNIAVTQL